MYVVHPLRCLVVIDGSDDDNNTECDVIICVKWFMIKSHPRQKQDKVALIHHECTFWYFF